MRSEFELKELELEKMQMRQLAKTHAAQLQDRDLRVRKLVQQVEGANDVIRRQRVVLEDHDIRTVEELGPTPFTPPGELRLSIGRGAEGDPSWGKRDGQHSALSGAGASRQGSAAQRGGSRFPELRTGGSRAASARPVSGRQYSARSRQRSREKGGLLRDMARLRTASAERERRAKDGEKVRPATDTSAAKLLPSAGLAWCPCALLLLPSLMLIVASLLLAGSARARDGHAKARTRA